jgi:FtsK/SpoIIIE family
MSGLRFAKKWLWICGAKNLEKVTIFFNQTRPENAVFGSVQKKQKKMHNIKNISAFFSTYNVGELFNEPYSNGTFDSVKSTLVKVADLERKAVSSQNFLLIGTGEKDQQQALQLLFQVHGKGLGCRGSYANFLNQSLYFNIVQLVPETSAKANATVSVTDDTVQPYTTKTIDVNTDIENQIQSVFKKMGVTAQKRASKVALQITTYCYKIAVGNVKKALSTEIELKAKLDDNKVISVLNNGILEIQVPNKHFDSRKTPLIFDKKNIDKNAKVPIYVGLDTNGKHVTIDMSDNDTAHAIIGGMSGSGKSVAINTIIAGMKTRSNIEFVLMDGKIVEFQQYNSDLDIKFWNESKVVNKENDAYEMIFNLQEEMHRRNQYLAENNCKNINETDLPHIVVIIDEFIVFFNTMNTMEVETLKTKTNGSTVLDIKEINTGKEIAKMVESIVKLSRAAGIHLILCTQQCSEKVMNTGLRDQMGLRIAFLSDAGSSKMILNNTTDAPNLIGNGDCVVKYKTVKQRVQSAIVERDQVRNEVKPTPKQTALFTQQPSFKK